MNYKLILASQSPRRKELLSHLGIPFDVKKSLCDEVQNGESALDVASTNAKMKCLSVFAEIESLYENPIVIGADTVVHIDGDILGKPTNGKEAEVMLLQLENSWHDVMTAVYIKTEFKEKILSCSSKVHFGDIDRSALEQYLSTKDSLDKAGAYGIQGGAQMFIDELKGSYSNVVGFPLSDFLITLKELIDCEKNTDYRKVFI